jgi:nucleotide-binding universal stress UspA family protein
MDPIQHTIVCGLDGSRESGKLSRFAGALARTLGAALELVHVAGAPATHPLTAAGAATDHGGRGPKTHFGTHARLDVDSAPTTERVVPYGDPARRLAIVAGEKQALLIVVGTHGRGPVADVLVGSVSSRLAADAPCPVLVVPAAVSARARPERWRGRTIACGVDGSTAAWAAARHAAMLAARLGGSLQLISVRPPSLQGSDHPADWTAAARELQDIAARCVGRDDGAAPLNVSRQLRHGDPAFELERVAAVIASPLLALGSRGRGPSREALLGTVARQVLQAARRPTLVVPATSLMSESADAVGHEPRH